MNRTSTLQVELATLPGITGVAARTVVALPPSTQDLRDGGYGGYSSGYAGMGATLVDDEMRVEINGVTTWRAYDPEVD
jgi:hypothetical protein